MNDSTGTFLVALVAATEERKAAALRVLQGEAEGKGHRSDFRMPEPYVGLQDVAEFMRVSTRSVWRWQVPGHRFGNRIRFRMSEVVAYLESDGFRQRIEELKDQRAVESKQRTADRRR